MKSLGITGNIGSGKSSVLNIVKNMGNTTYDLDDVAKNFYKNDPNIKNDILEIFPKVKSNKNEIDIKKLGKIVFNDSKKLRTLQEIIWPQVEKYIINKIKNTSNLLIFEGALIIEAEWYKLFDFIWIIDSKVELSQNRVTNSRNLSKKDFEMILSHQNNINEMVKILSMNNVPYSIITNNSDFKSLQKETEKKFKNLSNK